MKQKQIPSYLNSMKFVSFFVIFLLNLTTLNPQQNKTESKNDYKKWAYVYSNSLEKFSRNYIKKIQENYDVLCVTGLMLRGTGVLRFENELINKLQKAEIDYKASKPLIYPMVTFSSIKDGINLLTRENPRAKSIDNLINFLKRHQFKGLHLDFEGLPAEYSKDLGIYLSELKKALSENEMKLTFALFPQVEFSDDRLFHKMENIAPNVDEVVLMAYDYKNTKTDPGCVSPPEWVKKNIQEVLKQFSPDKVWVGLASYGYEWNADQKRVSVVSAREGEVLLSKYPFEKDKSSCVKITKKEGNSQSVIYYSNRETRKEVIEKIKNFSVLGTALWRLGLEED